VSLQPSCSQTGARTATSAAIRPSTSSGAMADPADPGDDAAGGAPVVEGPEIVVGLIVPVALAVELEYFWVDVSVLDGS